MVQFNLPEKSRVKPGKTWPKPASAKRLTEFRIYRWNPDDDANPRIDTYFVDRDDCGPMVLDALIWIKIEDRSDADLPPLLPRGRLRLLRHEHRRAQHARLHARHRRGRRRRSSSIRCRIMEVVKDLVPDLTHLLRAARVDRALAQDRRRRRPRRNGSRRPRIARSSTASTSASSAPAARPPARATGGTATAISAPRSLLQAYRWLIDSRDEARGERLDNLEDPFRLYRCHTIMNCAKTCPKGLNPAKAIVAHQEHDGRAADGLRARRPKVVRALLPGHAPHGYKPRAFPSFPTFSEDDPWPFSALSRSSSPT